MKNALGPKYQAVPLWLMPLLYRAAWMLVVEFAELLFEHWKDYAAKSGAAQEQGTV